MTQLVQIARPVQLLRDGKGIYGIGVAKYALGDFPARNLILRPDRFHESVTSRAALQMIVGGFRRGPFFLTQEESFRQIIHHDLLRQNGLAWPPPHNLQIPYWSRDPQQKRRNREIYHGLRLGFLSIVNRLICQALEEAANPDAVKFARRFRMKYRYAIYRAAASSHRQLQIAAEFPALALALFANFESEHAEKVKPEAMRLVEAGAPLKQIAELLRVSMAFRVIKPGAADLALYVNEAFEDERHVHAFLPPTLPKMKLWLKSIYLAKDFGPEYVYWIAKHSLEINGNANEVLNIITDISDWIKACLSSGVPEAIEDPMTGESIIGPGCGGEFVTRRFQRDMSLQTVTRLSNDWHEAVAGSMNGPNSAFPEPWLLAGNSCGFDINPITNTADLYREGQAMHHCVGTRAHGVVEGKAYYYSVCKQQERVATIELVRVDDHVSLGEARGFCNSQVSKEVARAVKLWCQSQRVLCVTPKLSDIDSEVPF